MTGQFLVSHVRGGEGKRGVGGGWWLIFNMWNEKHQAMVYSMSDVIKHQLNLKSCEG
jgi:hypothetical protein